MNRRIHVFYSGQVQGVGFRITVEEMAQRFGAVGWVKNLRDRRVELMAEGEEDSLFKFLDAIRAGPMKNFIKGIDVSWSEATGTFEEFEIRYY